MSFKQKRSFVFAKILSTVKVRSTFEIIQLSTGRAVPLLRHPEVLLSIAAYVWTSDILTDIFCGFLLSFFTYVVSKVKK
jgi:hypothetical protein